jgi:hypothetical protein
MRGKWHYLPDVESLLRAEVEELLRGGARWQITYCAGGDLPGATGKGLEGFPDYVLNHVPNPAGQRKIARGKSTKSWFAVSLEQDADGALLRFVE